MTDETMVMKLDENLLSGRITSLLKPFPDKIMMIESYDGLVKYVKSVTDDLRLRLDRDGMFDDGNIEIMSVDHSMDISICHSHHSKGEITYDTYGLGESWAMHITMSEYGRMGEAVPIVNDICRKMFRNGLAYDGKFHNHALLVRYATKIGDTGSAEDSRWSCIWFLKTKA